jgi:hypothetical protein
MDKDVLIEDLRGAKWIADDIVSELSNIISKVEKIGKPDKPEDNPYDDLFIECGLPLLHRMSVSQRYELEQVLKDFSNGI